MSSQRFAAAALLAGAVLALQAAGAVQAATSHDVAALRLPTPVTSITPPPSRVKTAGKLNILLRLTDPPLIVAMGANAKHTGGSLTLAQRQAYMAKLKAAQDALMAQVRPLGGTELVRMGKGYNAVVVSAPVSALPRLAALSGVVAARELPDLQRASAETVPYIGATALQNAGVTGAGVKIAILDTGIDYTHHHLGGSGTAADYAAASDGANATHVPAGLFPTAKVIGGYDFVGETWPNGALLPDPNPIDAGSDAGHGTHVSDIAAGASLDGTHKGVAPGAKLYAVKVCSSVSTSCSGVAILEGLEWAADPHGDLSFTDSADVVNMSLGGGYGQRDQDSVAVVSNLVRFGIVVAIAAGNDGDRPYIVSAPSVAPEAISVAQTQVPSAFTSAVKINTPSTIAGLYGNTATVDWAPIGAGFTGDVVYVGRGCPGDTLLADPTGKVALVDRGNCSVSLKVDNVAVAGAKAVLLGLIASGDAVSFSNGGGTHFVPTLVIQQVLSNKIKNALGGTIPVNVTVSDATKVALGGSMASTSARGPSMDFSTIKPEIGAPGASISAIAGSGNGEEAFGGTSGATPMIAGSAALLLQKSPTLTPGEVKARLMNAANKQITTNPAVAPGVLAPISRIGAGEVRVDKAAALTTAVWDSINPFNGGLSFGAPKALGTTTMIKKVAVRNYSSSARSYAISTAFRYADDAATGAVAFSAPASLAVAANSTGTFILTLTLDSSKLPAWNGALESGADQGTGALLQQFEFDGYLTVSDASDTATVPWHILPHKAASVAVDTSSIPLGGGSGSLTLHNAGGAVDGVTEVFALMGTSPQYATVLNPYGSDHPVIDLKAVGVRETSDVVQFAISTYGPRAITTYPGGFEIDVDVDNDGLADYAVYNQEDFGFALSGQSLVYVVNLASGVSTAYFYTVEDLNSGNLVLTAPLSALGLAANQKFTFTALAFDNYFTGSVTDSISNMVYTLGKPKFKSSLDEVVTPVGGSRTLTVTAPAGGVAATPSQAGFLLLHSDAVLGRESDVVTVTP